MVAAFDTLPPASDAPVCDTPGCNEPATLAYRWDWGQTGVSCAKHAALAQQKATSLKRAVVIHPIQQAAPEPLTRDERVQLKATAMVLEEDLKAAQSAGQQLHAKNADLQVQLSAALVKQRELSAQLDDGRAKLREAQAWSDELSAENGRLLAELDRLKHLDALVQEREAAAAHERGLEGRNVVDGG